MPVTAFFQSRVFGFHAPGLGFNFLIGHGSNLWSFLAYIGQPNSTRRRDKLSLFTPLLPRGTRRQVAQQHHTRGPRCNLCLRIDPPVSLRLIPRTLLLVPRLCPRLV